MCDNHREDGYTCRDNYNDDGDFLTPAELVLMHRG